MTTTNTPAGLWRIQRTPRGLLVLMPDGSVEETRSYSHAVLLAREAAEAWGNANRVEDAE